MEIICFPNETYSKQSRKGCQKESWWPHQSAPPHGPPAQALSLTLVSLTCQLLPPRTKDKACFSPGGHRPECLVKSVQQGPAGNSPGSFLFCPEHWRGDEVTGKHLRHSHEPACTFSVAWFIFPLPTGCADPCSLPLVCWFFLEERPHQQPPVSQVLPSCTPTPFRTPPCLLQPILTSFLLPFQLGLCS